MEHLGIPPAADGGGPFFFFHAVGIAACTRLGRRDGRSRVYNLLARLSSLPSKGACRRAGWSRSQILVRELGGFGGGDGDGHADAGARCCGKEASRVDVDESLVAWAREVCVSSLDCRWNHTTTHFGVDWP